MLAVQEQQRLQQEEQTRQFHEAQRQKAKDFRQESGIGELMERFAETLKTKVTTSMINPKSQEEINRMFPDYHSSEWTSTKTLHDRGEVVDFFRLRRAARIEMHDPDSTLDYVSWGHWSRPGNWLGIGSGRTTGFKFTAAETTPDGTIVFHKSMGNYAVPRGYWIFGIKELEKGLEAAFNKPRTFQEYIPPSPPPFKADGTG